MEAVEKEYDIIILDSAPVLTTSDTAILGVKADALLIVYRSALVTKEMLKRASSQLKQVHCNILGVVLNGVKSDLIPDALRDKYPQYYSTEALPNKLETTTVKDKKKNRSIKILILLELIILLISGLLWHMGIIFPEKFFPPETEMKNSEKTPVITEPAEKDSLPEKKADTVKSEASSYTPNVAKEEGIPAATDATIKVDEKKPPIEVVKPVYQEGAYPYSIYLGSFKTVERAQKAVDEYAEKEINTFPVRLDFAEKGIWYRVYSGYYPDAVSGQAFIKENNLKDAEIIKTPYACYIDSFTDNEALEKSLRILKEKQYFPYVITDHVDNVHFLFAGAFLSRNGAQELSEELRASGINNKVVSR
jgi:cell division septation protein DedD